MRAAPTGAAGCPPAVVRWPTLLHRRKDTTEQQYAYCEEQERFNANDPMNVESDNRDGNEGQHEAKWDQRRRAFVYEKGLFDSPDIIRINTRERTRVNFLEIVRVNSRTYCGNVV